MRKKRSCDTFGAKFETWVSRRPIVEKRALNSFSTVHFCIFIRTVLSLQNLSTPTPALNLTFGLYNISYQLRFGSGSISNSDPNCNFNFDPDSDSEFDLYLIFWLFFNSKSNYDCNSNFVSNSDSDSNLGKIKFSDQRIKSIVNNRNNKVCKINNNNKQF